MRFFELRQDRGLQIYGICLCTTLMITFYFWQASNFVAGLEQSYGLNICWPYYPACGLTQAWTFKNLIYINSIMGLCGLFGGIAFYLKKANLGAWLLGLGTFVKFFIFSQDYRLMGNYHYMAFVVILFFLFVPQRVQALQFLIPIFYISAGMLKLNPEWLSGANLLTNTWIPQLMLYPSLLAVIGLELVLAPLLIFVRKETWIWRFSFLSLVVFHTVSWHLVGFYYPMIMFCLLAYYLTCRPEPARWPGPIALFALALVALPQLARTFLPGTGIEGSARLLSLNMLDSMPQCQNHFIVKTKNQTTFLSLDTESLAPRIRCDPILFVAEVNRLCALKSSSGPFKIDLIVEVKNAVTNKFTNMIDLRDVCTKKPRITWLGEITL